MSFMIYKQLRSLHSLCYFPHQVDLTSVSLQYIFVIYVGMHQSNYLGLSRGRSWDQPSVCGDDPCLQQSSHAAVYTLLHNFTFHSYPSLHWYSNYPMYICMSYYYARSSLSLGLTVALRQLHENLPAHTQSRGPEVCLKENFWPARLAHTPH